jgi:hypothetical protein
MVGRGRNCSEPIARLRDPGGSGHSVAHLLCSLSDRLWLRPQHDVFARISKCRCAKRERKHDARASDRPAAQATWSAYCFHALIVMPVRISRKLICRRFETKIRQYGPNSKSQSVQRKCSRRRFVSRAFASSLRPPPAAASFSYIAAADSHFESSSNKRAALNPAL